MTPICSLDSLITKTSCSRWDLSQNKINNRPTAHRTHQQLFWSPDFLKIYQVRMPHPCHVISSNHALIRSITFSVSVGHRQWTSRCKRAVMVGLWLKEFSAFCSHYVTFCVVRFHHLISGWLSVCGGWMLQHSDNNMVVISNRDPICKSRPIERGEHNFTYGSRWRWATWKYQKNNIHIWGL